MSLNIDVVENSKESSDSIHKLDSILSKSCNIAIWKRNESPAPLAIQELVDSSFQALQFVYHRPQPLELIGYYFDDELDLKSPDAFNLIQDILTVTQKFLALCNDPYIGIRLERVTHDNCKAFHIDFLELRLICTYYGAATEWVENSNVNREYLGKNQNDLVIKDKNLIQQFKTNWVGLFKGENFPENAGNGVVHRSPQISNLKKNDRILLRIDTLERYGSHL